MSPDTLRPVLDLARARLPLPLPSTPLAIDDDLATRWLDALGSAAGPSRVLVELGILPPAGLAGNTIFLAFTHYDLTGGIYAREQVTYRRPVRLQETLLVQGEIAATYRRRGRRYRIMTSTSRDALGEVVIESRSTGIASYQASGEAADDPVPEVAAPGPWNRSAAANPSRAALVRLGHGQVFEGASHTVSLAMMRAASGRANRNPIHTDPEVARAHGLDAPIAGGPHVLAFVQELLMSELGEECLLWGAAFDVRWIRPVRADTTVRAHAKVVETRSTAVRFEIGVMNANGEPALAGEAVIPLESVQAHGRRRAAAWAG